MAEITKARADEITSAWDAASDTERLSMPRMSWVHAGDTTSYFEAPPSPLELKAAARIAELEHALTAAARHLEDVYGSMPTDRPPGPPTSIIETMRAIALRK